ncbi:unnamed protein product [Cylindrotheca closterium]|uniref:Uncharacterized protein n=1 Tax=Cylindrotheca closterium TaxID=2856 RepID=A0AAD2CK16_9STRA|nr:unnamed protein product [Cylindrotheca closterium]
MHGYRVTTNYDWLPWNIDSSIPVPEDYTDMPLQPLGDKQAFYENHMQGCRESMKAKGRSCKSYENARIDRCVRQPRGVHNYTKIGYHKMRAPEGLFQIIKTFWETNKDKEVIETWDSGDIAVNHWESPTYRVPLEDTSMEGGGPILMQQVYDGIRDIMSEWTGQYQVPNSVYGIRIYKQGAVLAPHVDRLPLVSSAIINVDQDLDEPWPLEVIGHDGLATNITMEPGDLVLYESHSIIHGRQFPLKGSYMANLFIHFEPIGPIGTEVNPNLDLPIYIVKGSEIEIQWQLLNRGIVYNIFDNNRVPTSKIHEKARQGNTKGVTRILDQAHESVFFRDINGRTPLHEAVQSGNVNTISVILSHAKKEKGYINQRTKQLGKVGAGGSALYYAVKFHGFGHPMVELLKQNGAKSIPPESTLSSEL